MKGTTYNINLNNVNINNKVLFAGPWVGEFGWELFCWQAHIRKISKNYKKVIIMSRSGHDFLYEDFADEFVEFNTPPNAIVDSWRCVGHNEQKMKEKISTLKFDVQQSNINIGFVLYGDGKMSITDKFKNQEFVKYQSNSLNKKFDILIHPRNRKVGDVRNWSKKNWQTLIDKLKDKFSIAMIGSNETYTLESVEDYRNISIKDTVSLMNRTKLVIGPSSGPMHLASLVGAPHFVWSTPHNKIRYEQAWNPFQTPVYFYGKEAWNPSVENIYNKILNILK